MGTSEEVSIYLTCLTRYNNNTMKVLGIIAALIASVTAHPALPHPHPASYHAAPGPYHPVPYHPAPPVYHPAPAPYKPAPAPYKPAHPTPYVEYPDGPVILCPNYPYCDEAPYALSHLQYEIDALRKRTALVNAHGEAVLASKQEPNHPFVGGVYY